MLKFLLLGDLLPVHDNSGHFLGMSIFLSDSDDNASDDQGGVGFWTTLFDAGVSHKTLMAVIYYQLDQPRLVCSYHALHCIVKYHKLN